MSLTSNTGYFFALNEARSNRVQAISMRGTLAAEYHKVA